MLLLVHRTRGNNGIFDGSWEGPDDPINFLNNKKKFGESWIWNKCPVTYTYNSQGYRCPEFDSIDWSNQIIIFGCSHTFGTGVSDEQTISSHLTKLGWPTVNLGQPGTGADYQFINSVILKENNIKPKAVIYNWPYPARMLQWVEDEKDQYRLWGPWNTGKKDWGRFYIFDSFHSVTQALWYSRAVNVMWNCPIIEVTRHKELSEKKNNITLLEPYVDHARDWNGEEGHAGPKTNLISAKLLADILLEKFS